LEAELSAPPVPETPSRCLELTRSEIHFRRIDMRGYRRSDGLFEVEGRVTDRKPFPFTPASSDKTVPSNEPIHDMVVQLIYNEAMIVQDVHALTNAAPYEICPSATSTLQCVKGLRIGPGWSSEVRSRLKGARSCTHLMELLLPLATTAIQSMSVVRMGQPEPVDENGRPRKIDTCFAYSAERELVRQRWPQFSRVPPMDN
jgi:hypothetical protein